MTVTNSGLNQEQIDSYWAQGYCVLPGLIDAPALTAYDQRFLAYVNGELELPEAMKIMQDVMVVKGAVAPTSPAHGVNKLLCLEYDPVLFDFARHPALVAAVQSLLGESLFSLSSNVFNKPPGVDGRHPMHQDLRYFRLRPADKIVGVWTAMLPATRAHGCLAVLPGSHREGILEHGSPDWDYVNHGFYGIDEIDLTRRVHVELEPGDTLLFHPLLVHGSGRNRTDAFRRAISIHYAAGDCESPHPDWQSRGLTRKVA
ncbi:MAG: phytanoyl-CoA dioxygenase family protein [Pseudomonadota bacterium]